MPDVELIILKFIEVFEIEDFVNTYIFFCFRCRNHYSYSISKTLYWVGKKRIHKILPRYCSPNIFTTYNVRLIWLDWKKTNLYIDRKKSAEHMDTCLKTTHLHGIFSFSPPFSALHLSLGSSSTRRLRSCDSVVCGSDRSSNRSHRLSLISALLAPDTSGEEEGGKKDQAGDVDLILGAEEGCWL